MPHYQGLLFVNQILVASLRESLLGLRASRKWERVEAARLHIDRVVAESKMATTRSHRRLLNWEPELYVAEVEASYREPRLENPRAIAPAHGFHLRSELRPECGAWPCRLRSLRPAR